MLKTPVCAKQYQSAQERFLKPNIVQFFQKNFPGQFGPIIADKIADEMMLIFQKLQPDRESIEVGQVLWNALDKKTRGDSPNRRFVPVTLTLVNQNDIEQLKNGTKPAQVHQQAIARIILEAFEQGGILSNRDVALLTLNDPTKTSQMRVKYETEHNLVLPHTGVLHDMGSCITHKKQIVYKVVVEKKDPTIVAAETAHTIQAVDHYVQNYNRVKTAFMHNPDINSIHFLTNIAKNVIIQYINIFTEFELQK